MAPTTALHATGALALVLTLTGCSNPLSIGHERATYTCTRAGMAALRAIRPALRTVAPRARADLAGDCSDDRVRYWIVSSPIKELSVPTFRRRFDCTLTAAPVGPVLRCRIRGRLSTITFGDYGRGTADVTVEHAPEEGT